MLQTNFKRVAMASFLNFFRNGFVTLASVLVLIVTLSVIGSMLFLGVMLNSSLAELRSKVDVNVYFVTTTEEEDILALKRQLEALPEVQSVAYVSAEQALENFRVRHENDQLTLQALDELGENPLGAVLNVRANDPSQYGTIAEFLKSGNALSKNGNQIVDKVNYFQEQHKNAIDRLTKIIKSGQQIGLAILTLFIVTSVLITFNTIRLAIYTSREEISVMRLVGASNMYIRGPFIISGILYGFLSGLVVLLLFYPMTYWLGSTTADFFGGVNIFEYYLGHFAFVLFVIVGSGILLGALSSYLAVRRYLKV